MTTKKAAAKKIVVPTVVPILSATRTRALIADLHATLINHGVDVSIKAITFSQGGCTGPGCRYEQTSTGLKCVCS
jgi:hypothetical protein